jgi:hypothetical protein
MKSEDDNSNRSAPLGCLGISPSQRGGLFVALRVLPRNRSSR